MTINEFCNTLSLVDGVYPLCLIVRSSFAYKSIESTLRDSNDVLYSTVHTLCGPTGMLRLSAWLYPIQYSTVWCSTDCSTCKLQIALESS
jgi:hypothetical protein